jgi:hypothetical protein
VSGGFIAASPGTVGAVQTFLLAQVDGNAPPTLRKDSCGQVNLVLGPETHNGADKKSGMRAMTRTNSGTGPFALVPRTIKSSLGRYWND